MIRVLSFIVLVFLLGLGFAWLADRPGDLVVTFNGYQYQVSLMVAAVAVVAIVAAVMILWWLAKTIWNSPRLVSRYFRARKRDRGYQSLSTGMIAAGAGDAALARRMNKQASKLLSADQEPLLHLLEAQALLLEGNHAAAREKFEAMAEDPETRLLGLRGLYLEAERLHERGAALHYAERAAEAAPQLGWASTATLEAKTAAGDWDGALALVDTQKSTRQIEKNLAHRRRAVLLTAKAMSLLDSDPLAARNAALEANRLEPELVPAAVTAARALFRQDDLRKGARILEAIWKKQPHPEIAAAYVHARPGDSTHDRLKRARKLEALKRNHPDSALAVARAALDAGEFREARKAIEAALRMSPSEGAYLLLADIEEADTGDQGRVRHWLAKAVRAPRDPAWTADGHVSEHWAPVSPVTGRLDAFEWRVPVERLGPVIDSESNLASEAALKEIPLFPPEPAHPQEAPVAATPAGEAEASAVIDHVEPQAEPAGEITVTPEQASPAKTNGEDTDARPLPPSVQPIPIREFQARRPAEPPVRGPLAEERTISGPPDDPGVPDDEAENGEPARFRLF